MTKLEKIGLIIAIPSGIVTILEYLEKINFIKYIKENFEWIPLKIKDVIVWFYENVILLEINIWILLLVVFAIYKLNTFYRNKKTPNDISEEAVPKSLLDIFNDFYEDTQKVFGYIMYCQEKNINCTEESIKRKFINDNVSNIEIDKIIESFIDKNIVEPNYSVINPTRFTLTTYGSDIAVALVKQSKGKKGK